MLCESMQDMNEIKKLDRGRYKANTKWDGERVMAFKRQDDVVLFNRGGNIVTHKFMEVVNVLKTIKNDFIIDGEVIAYDNDFSKLQRRALTKDLKKIEALQKEIPVKYMVFDILFYAGKTLMRETLESRLVCLSQVIQDSEYVELCEYGDIDNLLMQVIEENGEGIVIKDMLGTYESKRSKNWIKHKLFKETTITITAFTDNPKGIRATDDEGNAVQVSGHHADTLKSAMESKGKVLVNVQYLTKGKDGRMRFPSYRGLAE